MFVCNKNNSDCSDFSDKKTPRRFDIPIGILNLGLPMIFR